MAVKQTGTTVVLTKSSNDPKSPISAVAEVSQNRLRAGEAVSFWIQFQNTSKSAIDNFRFAAFDAPGFVRQGKCWSTWPKCDQDGKPVSFPLHLEPNESIVINGDLLAREAGDSSVAAVYSWSNPSRGELRGVITIGPITIVSAWQTRLVNVFGRLTPFILPLGLALAGALLQFLQKTYEDARREVEEERTRTTTVLTTLLPTQAKNTETFYLPFASRLSTLEVALDKIAKLQAQSEENTNTRQYPHAATTEVAYALAMLLRHRQFMLARLGGIHLQSRCGENAVRALWLAFQHAMRLHVDKGPLASINKLKRQLNFITFESLVNGSDQALSEFRNSVSRWVSDPADPATRQIPLLKMLGYILAFEINRPFRRWYGEEREPFPAEKLEALEGDIKAPNNVPTDQKRAQLNDEVERSLRAYIEFWKKQESRG